MIHVSAPIIWISPIVDVTLFLLLSLGAWGATRLVSRHGNFRVLGFLLTYFAVYGWLTVTARLYRLACVLFALGAAIAVSRWAAANSERIARCVLRTLPAVVGLYALAFLGIQGSTWWQERFATAALPSASGVPNVLVIILDTLRADHVSAYGYARPTTPNIDLLGQQGSLFENAVSPSSWSLPSHVSLVTGRYLHAHGVGNVQREPWLGWKDSSLGGLPTIGEELQKRGYRTGAFSANRAYFSKDLGFGRGFIHFEDYFNSASDAFVRTLYGREFARIYLKRSDKSLVKRILRRLGWKSFLDQDAEGSGSYGGAFGIRKHATEVNQEFLGWMDKDRNHPFFAFLNYFDVHDPYGGPSSYEKPAWSHDTKIDLYDDGVKYVDDCIGELMRSLQEKGVARNTFIIVTSDHGESLGQHHLETHGRALYWELVHVPLILWYPGHVPEGVRVPQPVSNLLIPASVLSMVGKSTGPFEGPPLQSIGPGRPGAANPMSELAENKYPGKHDLQADRLIPTATAGSMKTLITSQYQLISHSKLGNQLYDLRADPGEIDDLANTMSGKDTTGELERDLLELTQH